MFSPKPLGLKPDFMPEVSWTISPSEFPSRDSDSLTVYLGSGLLSDASASYRIKKLIVIK